jgi:hypothetical protein
LRCWRRISQTKRATHLLLCGAEARIVVRRFSHVYLTNRTLPLIAAAIIRLVIALTNACYQPRPLNYS